MVYGEKIATGLTVDVSKVEDDGVYYFTCTYEGVDVPLASPKIGWLEPLIEQAKQNADTSGTSGDGS